MLDEIDKKIIAAMQEELPIVSDPYRQLAEKLDISEAELIARLQNYLETGTLRKFGAVLRHKEIGYDANALCVWQVDAGQVGEVAAVMVAEAAVSHCYERLPQPDWPYNFYTMLHAETRPDCEALAAKLAEKTGLTEYLMLFTIKEWKKTSMQYFAEFF